MSQSTAFKVSPRTFDAEQLARHVEATILAVTGLHVKAESFYHIHTDDYTIKVTWDDNGKDSRNPSA